MNYKSIGNSTKVRFRNKPPPTSLAQHVRDKFESDSFRVRRTTHEAIRYRIIMHPGNCLVRFPGLPGFPGDGFRVRKNQ